jgi:hypothetical protein
LSSHHLFLTTEESGVFVVSTHEELLLLASAEGAGDIYVQVAVKSRALIPI